MLSKICPVCKSEYEAGEVFCPNDGTRLTTASELAAAPAASDDPLLGAVIDERYRVIRRIGEGGMGIVYEVEHIVIEKRLALKVLRDDYSKRPDVVARFRQEAKSASRIGSEHIVDISDFGETPSGASYFVMELLDGEDLSDTLAREGTLPLARTVDILCQCARSLASAHAKGIVHRDMKPENIFLIRRDDRPDFVKIVDFGIAKMSDLETPGQPGRKLTKTGMIFGTPEYMSPEQAAGRSLDHRVDIYALGVIFFELLTGRVPFTGDTFMGILTQHMFEEPPRLSQANPSVKVPDSVEAFVQRALAKEPNDRFATCDEFIEVLEQAVRGIGPSDAAPIAKRTGTLAGASASERSTRMGYGDQARPVAPPQEPLAIGSDEGLATRPKRSMLGAGIVLIVLAGGGAALAYLWLGREGATADPPNAVSSSSTPPDTPDAAILIPDAFIPAPDAAEPDAGPERIGVGIVTTPAGARIEVVGDDGISCESAPCTLLLPVGEHVRLQAHLGARTTTVEVDVVRGMAPILVRLRGGGGSSRPDDDPSDPAGPLKIPTLFRDRP